MPTSVHDFCDLRQSPNIVRPCSPSLALEPTILHVGWRNVLLRVYNSLATFDSLLRLQCMHMLNPCVLALPTTANADANEQAIPKEWNVWTAMESKHRNLPQPIQSQPNSLRVRPDLADVARPTDTHRRPTLDDDHRRPTTGAGPAPRNTCDPRGGRDWK